MSVKFQNFDYCYYRNGKPIFAPTRLGRRIGRDIKRQVESAHVFPDYYHHLKPGGHILALHAHRSNSYFCKIDLRNFFYSCGRNRIAAALRAEGIGRHYKYAKWSCVRNPFGPQPTYSLPYGFVQSPILASLALAHSTLGAALEELKKTVSVAVFVDDISLSSNDFGLLRSSLALLRESVETSPFSINDEKTVEPTANLSVFNCDLKHGSSSVTQERIDKFYSIKGRTRASIDGFEMYRNNVIS